MTKFIFNVFTGNLELVYTDADVLNVALALDGSNANSNINIGAYDFTTTGTITSPTIADHPHQDVQTTAGPSFTSANIGGIIITNPTGDVMSFDLRTTNFSCSSTCHINQNLSTTASPTFDDLTLTGDLKVDGYGAIGTTPNSLYGLYVRSSGSARTRGVYGYVFYSGTGAESYGGYFRGFNNVVPAGTYHDNYGGRFESSIYKNTIATGKTLRSYGGYFRAQDYSGRTYAGAGDYEFYGGLMLINNAAGDWTTNNPTVNTYGLKIGSAPTGYGSNHTHYALYTGTGLVYFGDDIEVTGRMSSGTLTVTASADNTDVSGVNIMFVNITSNIILGGLTGGVDGQVLHVVYKGNYTATCKVEDTEGVGDQDIYTHTRLDETVDGGGYTLVCDGSNWYDCSHARHV